MPDQDSTDDLVSTLSQLRTRIEKFRHDKAFNEQNTKASLIVPLLQALGWDAYDPEQVHWEYKPKPKSNPVDFALMLQRTPALFVEAKALRESLRDDKLVAQILTYASVAGVQWVVLTNGDEYRIYNSSAPVPAEEKVFRTVSISQDSEDSLVGTLLLLSNRNLRDKEIDRLWNSQFIDRQVKSAIEAMFSPMDPTRAIVSAIKRHSQGRLSDAEIRASLRRARLQLDFPVEPSAILVGPRTSPGPPAAVKTSARSPKRTRATPAGRVDLSMLIGEGLLSPPVRLFSKYRGHDLTATIQADGSIVHEGRQFWSPSIAGGAARKPFHARGKALGDKLPATNGWVFWQLEDPVSGKRMPLDAIRNRFLQKKKAEAMRFTKKEPVA